VLGFAVVVLFVTTVVAAHRPLLSGFARLFRVDDPAPSDVIVLLLGGTDHRPRTAASLYARGLAPRVLLGTSHKAIPGERNETDITISALQALGVPRSAIVVLPEVVTSTREEASAVLKYASAHGVRRITIVTTEFHTARARWIFRKFLRGQGIEIHMAASQNAAYNADDWYKTDEGLLAYMNEAFKTIYYRLRY
jgi:uncharacterized SAM-binding protein YcdF (DUF218 family)